MTEMTRKAILMVLHTDRQPTDAERTKALQAFNAWSGAQRRGPK